MARETRQQQQEQTERGTRRAETNAVAAYLNALAAPRPRRSREQLVSRREEIDGKLGAGDQSPMQRLKLVQARMDADTALAQLDDTEHLTELEDGFVKVAGVWCQRTGICRDALREVGVPADVLKRAGM